MLTVIYLMMALSPLAPLVMHSPVAALAVTGECSGDCDICGCSLESRSNHTCCCAKKRQQQAHLHEGDEDGTPQCCKKKPVAREIIIACGYPCGSGKTVAITASGTLEALPFHFTEQFSIPCTKTMYPLTGPRLISRHGEPPDPPPRLTPLA